MSIEIANPNDWQIPGGAPFIAVSGAGGGWEAFVNARTAEEKCRAWLDLICRRVPDAAAAAVLAEAVESNSFVPVAVWPLASPDLGRLAPVVERVLRERVVVVQPGPLGRDALHVAYPLMLGNRVAGLVAIEATCGDEDIEGILREIHWGSAWLANLLGAQELGEALQGRNRLAGVLEATAVALRHGKFQQAQFEMVNDLRQRFDCSRVALGLVRDAAVTLRAISDAASFAKNAPLAKAYKAAMEECYDAGKPLSASAEERSGEVVAEEDGLPPTRSAHRHLLAIAGARQVLSFPLMRGADCVALLTFERFSEAEFTAADLAWCDAFGALLAPIITQRLAAERHAISRARADWKALLARFFGPRHVLWKAIGSAGLLLTALLLAPIDYRVTAKAVVEGEVQRVVAAPFEGFIGAAHARAGDTVTKGQALATLDDRDLLIEQERWTSERDQYDKKLREATANHDLTAMQVIGAQLHQAEAQLALITEKVERARLVSPFDGMVVSGDLSQQVGAPVEAGKKLFEVAPLQSYRVILQVDEREIRHVQLDQPGRLVITGIAGEPMPFRVSKVTPVATAQEGRNYFRAEASLAEASPRLRPGMEGVGKIEVGSRSLWWIATHSFTDWLVLQLWTWMP